MGQVGKQTLRAHQAGGRKRWSMLRPQGAHLQPRPAGGGSQHSCPHQCSQQSPPHGHQHPGAAARGTGKTGRWEKSNSEGQNSQGCVLERRTGGFRVRRARTPRARLESTTSFFNLLYGSGCATGISHLQRALQSEQEVHLSSMLCTGSRVPPGNQPWRIHTSQSLCKEVWQLQGFVTQNLLPLSCREGKNPLPGEGERVTG